MTILRIYADSLVRALRAIGKAPWTLLVPMVYLAADRFIAQLVAPLGIIGGFLYGFANAALISSYLYILGELVRGSGVRLQELKSSLGAYLWSVINVFFVIWIASFLLGPLISSHPNGHALLLGLMAVLFILLNAVPEVIYQRGSYGGIATIMGSVQFIQDYWIEWLVPNVAFGALFWFGYPALVGALPVPIVLPVVSVLTGAVIHLLALFRGFLFESLDGSTGRQRALRSRFGR